MANATLAQKEKERQQMMRADQPFLLPQTPTRPSASLSVSPPSFLSASSIVTISKPAAHAPPSWHAHLLLLGDILYLFRLFTMQN